MYYSIKYLVSFRSCSSNSLFYSAYGEKVANCLFWLLGDPGYLEVLCDISPAEALELLNLSWFWETFKLDSCVDILTPSRLKLEGVPLSCWLKEGIIGVDSLLNIFVILLTATLPSANSMKSSISIVKCRDSLTFSLFGSFFISMSYPLMIFLKRFYVFWTSTFSLSIFSCSFRSFSSCKSISSLSTSS